MEKSFLIEDCTEKVNLNHHLLSEFRWPTKLYMLVPIAYEAAKCVVLEFSVAAITLTNHLLESSLKLALAFKETGIPEFGTPTQSGSNSTHIYDGYHLHNSIEKACKQDLIDKETAEKLLEIKDGIRNGFSHAELGKMFGNYRFPIILEEDETKHLIPPITPINVRHDPTFYGLALDRMCRDMAGPYLFFVLELIQKIESKLERQT